MSYILDALKKSERERTLMRGVGFGDAGRRLVPENRWIPKTLIAVVAISVVVVSTVIAVRTYTNARAAIAAAKTSESNSVPNVTVATMPAASTPALIPAVGEAKALADMPADFQSSLPPMQVNIHVYSPDESQRILYINNRQFRRGDEVASGVRVEEIVPDGVVLQFRGQRFKLARPS